MKQATIATQRVHTFVDAIFGEDLHAKRVLSLANATEGCLRAAALAVHAIGLGLAAAQELTSKHAIKQVDRLFSNAGIDVWGLFAIWVPFVVGSRSQIVVAMDWTDYDHDDDTTIALNMVTSHGRATPLLWKTVKKSELLGERNNHEDALLQRFKEALPEGVKVVVTADRGFGDVKLYALLKSLGFDFIIRFRENIYVTDSGGERRAARDWLHESGRARLIRKAKITDDAYEVEGVVVTKAKTMKDSWCLAISDPDMSAAVAIATYGKRFTIEETFRDLKDARFGLGLRQMSVSTPARRDRVILVSALAMALLTMLGAAGESTGLDMRFKANTSKARTHSLFRQGTMYYMCLSGMRAEWLEPLMRKFEELLREHAATREIFGIL